MSLVEVIVRVEDQTGPGLAAAAAKIASLKAAAAGLGGALGATQRDLQKTGIAADALAASAGRGGGVWGALRKDISLFGGALSGVPFLGAVTGLHVLIDSTIELAAVVLPAAIAFTAFGAAAVPTVISIAHQMANLNTVSSALDKTIYPLSGGFQQLANAVKPQVYMLFGDALAILGRKTGEFTTLATGAGHVVDNLASRFTLAITNGTGFNMFLSHAVQDLAKLGDIVGNLGGVLGNVFKVMPGYAEDLLNIADAGSKVAEWASHAAAPIIGLGLAFHGAALWMGVAGTGIGLLVSKGLGGIANLALNSALGMSKLGAAGERAAGGMLSFAAGAEGASKLPWGWIGAAAIGLGLLTYKLITAKDATQQWIASMAGSAGAAPAAKGLNMAMVDQTLIAHQLAEAQRQYGITVQQAAHANSALGFGFQATAREAQKGVPVITALAAGYKQFADQGQAYSQNLNMIAKGYGGLHNAEGLVIAAGLTFADMTNRSAAGLAKIKLAVLAVTDAYRAMGIGSGRQAAALSDMRLATDDQITAMQSLVKAEDFYIARLLSSEQAGIGFLQSLGKIGTDAKVAGASLDGLNSQSLTLAGDFYGTVVPAAQKVIDALQMQLLGTKKLTVAVADEAKGMVPFARGNTAARQTIVDLINNALGPGTVSLKNLNSWVKTNSGSMKGFRSILDQATVGASNLAKSIQDQLNAAFQKDVFQLSGASAAMKRYTSDLLNNAGASAKGRGDRAALIADLEKAGLSAKQAAARVQQLINEIAALHGKSITIQTNFITRGNQVIPGPRGTGGPGYQKAPGLGAGTMTAGAHLFGAPLATHHAAPLATHHAAPMAHGQATMAAVAAGVQSQAPQLTATMGHVAAAVGQGFKPVGSKLGQTLIQGLEGTIPQIKATITRMIGLVIHAYKAGDISKGGFHELIGDIQVGNLKLTTLAAERAKLVQAIANAKAYAANVTSATTSWATLSQAQTLSGQNKVTAQSIDMGLQDELRMIEAFSGAIKKLAKEGLNRVLLDQVIQMGPGNGGLTFARALEKATPAELKRINAAEVGITKQSTVLGRTAGNVLYNVGAETGKGFLTGLKDSLKGIESAMADVARRLIAELKRDLRIKSPSGVMADLGLMVSHGLASGITAGAPVAASAMSGLSDVVRRGVRPGGVAQHPGGGGGGVPVVLELNSSGSAVDEFLLQILRKAIRVRGGNVQLVMGHK